MRRPWTWPVAVALLAAGCAGAASAPPGGTPISPARPASSRLVLPPDTDPDRGVREIASRVRGAEVVYLGEMHDNARHHALQARVLRAILAAGGRPALAFEMVPESQQGELERAVRSDDTAAGVAQRLRWHQQGWPDFQMYWPLFEQAREFRLPVVAADLDPGVTRQINRDGLAGLREDPGRLRSALPPDPALDLTITRRIQTVHCNLVPDARAARMLESWYARNVTIARRVAGALGEANQVLVIIGRGHQSPGGVPAQLAALRPGTRQFVVTFAEVGDEPDEAIAERLTGDVVWLVPGPARPDPCKGLPQRLG